jgi:hypothetical protein
LAEVASPHVVVGAVDGSVSVAIGAARRWDHLGQRVTPYHVIRRVGSDELSIPGCAGVCLIDIASINSVIFSASISVPENLWKVFAAGGQIVLASTESIRFPWNLDSEQDYERQIFPPHSL